MICLKEVSTKKNGTYHNLYYETSWEELDFEFEIEDPLIVFYKKEGKNFVPLEFNKDDIVEIVQDESFPESDYVLVTSSTDDQIMLVHEELEYEEEVAGCICFGNPRLVELYGYYAVYFYNFLKEYKLKDAKKIIDTMINVCCSYMETVLDLAEKSSITQEEIFEIGWSLGVVMTVFVEKRLEKNIDDDLIRKDSSEIIVKFIDFIEKSKQRLNIKL